VPPSASDEPAGAEHPGPVLIEDPFTVIAVPSGATVRHGDHTKYESSL